MTRYLLDTNLLSYFLNTAHGEALSAAAKKMPMVIVDEVRVELEAHKSLGAGAKAWFPESNIELRRITVGSPEHDVLLGLLGGSPVAKDLGERASIALASTNAELVFVANDKGGMWIALRELHLRGERMLGVTSFLRRAHEEASLDVAAIDDVARVAGVPLPTWWGDWRKNL